MRFLFILLITSSVFAQLQVTTKEVLGLPNYGRVHYYSPPGVKIHINNAPNTKVVIMRPKKEYPNPNGIKLDTTLWMNRPEQKGKTVDELLKTLNPE